MKDISRQHGLAWAACLLGGALLSGCYGQYVDDETGEQPPQVVLYGVRIHSFEGDVLESSSRAAKVNYDRSSATFLASEFAVHLPRSVPGSVLEGGVLLRAPVLEGNLFHRQAQASGGVTLRSAGGLTGDTPRASFDGKSRTAWGNDPIQMSGPGYAMQGTGFDFDFDAQHYVFRQDIQSRLGAEQ